MMWAFARLGLVPGLGPTPPEMELAALQAKAFQGDTLVTYRDGETVMGAIVDEGHRLPLSYDQLPLAWRVAVVAAEDGGFWRHSGFSVQGVMRAVRDNLTAGTVVSGGSTITQQTVKNLLDRRKRTLGAKWEELDHAIHLEEVASKEDILTMYSNLFHVTGTNSGLGVAARHFFDQTPDGLSLLEHAFIAGQLQSPAAFDPFDGSPEAQAATRARAQERTAYVLRRICDERIDALLPPGAATTDVEALRQEARRLLEQGVVLSFRQGSFRYTPNTMVDEVQRRLQTKALREALAEAGHPTPAGLTVVTTLDPDVQRDATWGLWHHLTELGLRLEQGTVDDLIVAEADRATLPVSDVWSIHAFAVGTVTERTSAGELQVRIDEETSCKVDFAALDRLGRVLRVRPWQVSAGLPEGTSVWLSQREAGRCDLEAVPELQGAAFVVEEGRVRAMVGGHTNRDFDRTQAPRQFGSAFKPLIFHAAMSLGWRPDNTLPNYPMPFTYSKTVYEPRQDHAAPASVSLAQAGASSENVASVWLLVHLVDRMAFDGLSWLADKVGLARHSGESMADYRKRLRQAGIRVSTADLPDIAARMAAADYSATHPERRDVVTRTVWSVDSLERATSLMEACEQQFEALRGALDRGVRPTASDLSVRRSDRGLELACKVTWDEFVPVDGFAEFQPPDRPKRKRRRRAMAVVPPRPPLPLDLDRLYVGDALQYGELSALRWRQATILRELQADSGALHQPEILNWHGDFRTAMALRYVQDVAAQYGVKTELHPVLSLPLGACELTLQEITTLYAGLSSGYYATPQHPEVGPALLIQEIRDRTGRVIYRASPKPAPVLEPTVGDFTADILRNVVDAGTGRRARGVVKVRGSAVPIGGKTGTTNGYRNAAFVGFVPAAQDKGYDAASGHHIGVYVGYDDNREMKGRGLRVSGSVGALPPFRSIAKTIGDRTSSPPRFARPEGGRWSLRHHRTLEHRRIGRLDVLTDALALR
ncbi:MAG: transglycosylase domain-containing protein [Myxococcota bacterium]